MKIHKGLLTVFGRKTMGPTVTHVLVTRLKINELKNDSRQSIQTIATLLVHQKPSKELLEQNFLDYSLL